MKTDKELLELAAKAAGIDGSVDGEFCCGMWLRGKRNPDNSRYWSPLTDDGDALRLACDLGLRVYPIARTSTGAACSAVGSASSERLSEVCDQSIDVRTATRRAIVRAAAAIGETM